MMPTIRADAVHVLVFRARDEAGGTVQGEAGGAGEGGGARPADIELLQLRRAEAPGQGTWQPVIGGLRAGESAVAGALRELREETGLGPPAMLGMWALNQVRPYLVAAKDEIWMGLFFAARAPQGWSPDLSVGPGPPEHDAARWVPAGRVGRDFAWPNQIDAAQELMNHLLDPSSASWQMMRVDVASM